jgi:hypothetical protein
MMEFVGRIFSDEQIEPGEKKELLNIIKKKIDAIATDDNKNNG